MSRLEAIIELVQYVTQHTERVDPAKLDEYAEVATVDTVFFVVAARNSPDADELRKLIAAAKEGFHCILDPLDGKEHSYMEVGAWVGDQSLGLELMALGELLGLWKMVTPKTMGMPEDMYATMAAMGLVTIVPVNQTKEQKAAIQPAIDMKSKPNLQQVSEALNRTIGGILRQRPTGANLDGAEVAIADEVHKKAVDPRKLKEKPGDS